MNISFYWSVWVIFLILGYLNTEFRELILPVFSFLITLFNDTFVNIWKSVRPTIWQYPTSFLSLSTLFFFSFSLSCTLFLNILYSSSFFFCFFFLSFILFIFLSFERCYSLFFFSFFFFLVWMTCDAIWLLSLYSHAIFSRPLFTSFLIVIFSFASFLSGERVC